MGATLLALCVGNGLPGPRGGLLKVWGALVLASYLGTLLLVWGGRRALRRMPGPARPRP